MGGSLGEDLGDRFEIGEPLGEGGFAHVFRARDRTTGREVALKVLKEAFLTDAAIVERFRREVFAVASLRSPHIVGMHDFGISGRQFFIAMELVRGTTLREAMHEHPWTAGEVHLIIGQIAQALAVAHRQNIVHRDLKPENVILVGEPGGARLAKVLDFGLAKIADLESSLALGPLSKTGTWFGTPQYMSPDQIRGAATRATLDLYALGVITYEMIAAMLPWDGSTPWEIFQAMLNSEPPRIRRCHPSIERLEPINEFFRRALAKRPSVRPADAESFFRELEVALFGDARPVARTQLPPTHPDAAFASVLASPISLPEPGSWTDHDTFVETPPTDLPVEPKQPGETFTWRRRRSKMQAVWIHSPEPRSEEHPTLPRTRTPPTESTPVATTAPTSAPRAATRTSITGEVHSRRGRQPGVRVPVWLVGVLITLVIAATAVGFYVGRATQ